MKSIACFILLHLIFFTASAQSVDYSRYDFREADSAAAVLKGVKGYSVQELAVALTQGLDTEVGKIRAIYR